MNRRDTFLRALAVIAATGLSAIAMAGTVTGNGTWASTRFATKGTWETDLSQDTDALGGGFTLAGSPVFTGGTVAGIVSDGKTITFGIIQDGEKVATFSGTLSGTSVTGTYDSSVDKGVWSGTLTGISQ